MLKMYSFSFQLCKNYVIDWFALVFTVIIHLGTISNLALIGVAILAFLAYRYLENVKNATTT